MSVLYELWGSLVVKVVATIISPILLALLYYLFRRLYRAFQALRFAEAALAAVARRQEHDLWVEGPGFWLKPAIVRPANYDLRMQASIPIMMIATLKGGVGKTTLSASLAAHFAMRWTQRRQDPNTDQPLRVLLIDQDFQASLSTMTVSDQLRFRQPSKANRLVSGELGKGEIVGQAEPITRDGMVAPLSIATIPAYYDLAQAENRTVIEWLLPLSDYALLARLLRLLRLRDPNPPRSLKDVRYLLAEALLDPQVQANFDLVIIDAPPRLTTSHIQAMCASTDLLVPTILDRLSFDAVGRYLNQVAIHKLDPLGGGSRAICSHLKPVGVVCTIVPRPHGDLSGLLDELQGGIDASGLHTDIFRDCIIHHRPPYRDCAGDRIAYAADTTARPYEELRTEVDSLGDAVADKLGAKRRGWVRR